MTRQQARQRDQQRQCQYSDEHGIADGEPRSYAPDDQRRDQEGDGGDDRKAGSRDQGFVDQDGSLNVRGTNGPRARRLACPAATPANVRRR